MATIYEGTKNNQMVNENIDPMVLRLLGIIDVSDIDYDTYKTLLREALVASRVGRNLSAEEDTKLRDEFKRVRNSTGRFKVKQKKVRFDSLPGTPSRKPKQQSTSTPRQKLLPGSPGGVVVVQEEQAQQKKEKVQASKMSAMEFLTKVVSPALTRMETSLTNILSNIQAQQTAEEKTKEQLRKQGEKAKKREKEERTEGGSNMLKGFANTAKTILSPFNDVFGAIFNFIKNIFLGVVALKLLEFLQDPMKYLRDIANNIINFANDLIKSVFDFIMTPYNLFIDGLNNTLQGFAKTINETIGKFPGVPPLEIPLIDKATAPQIPLIPPPPDPGQIPQTNATTMAGGGTVNNITLNGGQVTGGTGQRVTGAGPDTQLVALQPGEVVMSKKAVQAYGASNLLALNKMAGGTNAPGMAQVTSVAGGGMIPTMQGGGIILNPPTMEAWMRAVAAARSEGIDLPSQVTSTFRSAAKQQQLIDRWRSGDPNVFTPAAVGKSPHQQGWALDINAGSEANKWMRENGGRFGFRWQGSSDPVHFDYHNDQPNEYWLQEGRRSWMRGGGSTQVQPQQSMLAQGGFTITGAKTTYYDPSLGGINASGYKTSDGLPATSTGEGYRPEVFSAAAFPPLLAQLPRSMTVPAQGFPGGRTLKEPFHVLVTNKDGRQAILRVNDVGPGVEGHSANHMLDLSVAAKNYLGTGDGFTIQLARPGVSAGPISGQSATNSIANRSFNQGGLIPLEAQPMTAPVLGGGQSPMVSPRKVSGVPGPPGSGGTLMVPVTGGQSPTSAATGGSNTQPEMFSPVDGNNPELLVVKSIFNIVG